MSVFLDGQTSGGAGGFVTGKSAIGETINLGFVPSFFYAITLDSPTYERVSSYVLIDGAGLIIGTSGSWGLNQRPIQFEGSNLTFGTINTRGDTGRELRYIAFK